MGVRASRRRPGTAPARAARRERRHRDARDRAAGPARCLRGHRRQFRRRANGAGEDPVMRFIRSALVIARRDFSATVLSKAFIFFLLAPLFPLLMGGVFSSISTRVAAQNQRPVVAVIAPKSEFDRLIAARDQVGQAIADDKLVTLAGYSPQGDLAAQ